jgi:hypothetical protein
MNTPETVHLDPIVVTRAGRGISFRLPEKKPAKPCSLLETLRSKNLCIVAVHRVEPLTTDDAPRARAVVVRDRADAIQLIGRHGDRIHHWYELPDTYLRNAKCPPVSWSDYMQEYMLSELGGDGLIVIPTTKPQILMRALSFLEPQSLSTFVLTLLDQHRPLLLRREEAPLLPDLPHRWPVFGLTRNEVGLLRRPSSVCF